MFEQHFYIYILTNRHHTVLYIGITNNLPTRIRNHKEGHGSEFTKKYNVNELVYYEVYDHPQDAIAREKQLKNYSRKKKEKLVGDFNPEWKDIFNEIALW